ncbi:MAG TPA: hypothetical protein VFP23_00330 [Solirubrobacterales bacterium]|nr:hypothetical protein [Solirubrobacterales bacterium]
MGERTKRALALAGALLLVSAALATAETSQKGNLRVAVNGKMTPQALPRTGTAPIAVSVGGRISTAEGSLPPQLNRLSIEINRHGRLDYQGLPVCHLREIQPATTARALSACRSSLVGQGTFSADVALKGQPPYPSSGRLLVFNGKEGAHQVLLGHIYTAQPFTNSFVITFKISRIGHGTYGTALLASLPQSLGSWGHVTGIDRTLDRRWSAGGRRHRYLSAGCPAPRGFRSVFFPLARASFAFEGGTKLSSTLERRCRAR